jgi:LmbE family N-acetylglucosaminyl deacetylase
MTEDKVAEIRINEAKKSVEFLGIPPENHHLFTFHDAEGQNYVKAGILKAKYLIKDCDTIVLPSNRNSHTDHQATHDISKEAAIELKMVNAKYFVYFISSYGKFQEDSKDKQFQYIIDEEKAALLSEWLNIYQSQAIIKWTWKIYTRYLKKIRTWT